MSDRKTPETRVLLVDDETTVIAAFSELLSERYTVQTASSMKEALEKAEVETFDVLVTDIHMPGGSGVELARELQQRSPDTEVIVITANPTVSSAVELIRIGVVDFLKKPFKVQDLESAIEKALARKRIRNSFVRMQTHSGDDRGLGRLQGESRAMDKLRAAISRIQHVDTTVLITGQTGAGKEVVARAIHEGGHRAGGPFLPVNCAALGHELLEAELFGYVKGAFTGATEDRAGLIESADGGTLLLDEIGEMSMDLQAKLLRVLQDKQVRRVGGTQAQRVDVRFLAATNRDLAACVKEGSFREDLFFRLNVYPIRVPSLARRREDLPDLAERLLVSVCEDMGLPERRFGDGVVEALARRDWPGNVRELRNRIERLALIAGGEEILLEHLEEASGLDEISGIQGLEDEPEDLADAAAVFDEKPDDGARDTMRVVDETGVPLTLEALERRYIERVLEDCGGNKTRAARVLGIHVSTLHRKLPG